MPLSERVTGLWLPQATEGDDPVATCHTACVTNGAGRPSKVGPSLQGFAKHKAVRTVPCIEYSIPKTVVRVSRSVDAVVVAMDSALLQCFDAIARRYCCSVRLGECSECQIMVHAYLLDRQSDSAAGFVGIVMQ